MINLLTMVKAWTGGAVSATTTINGGFIRTNTITAAQIAVNINNARVERDAAQYINLNNLFVLTLVLFLAFIFSPPNSCSIRIVQKKSNNHPLKADNPYLN